MKIHFFNLLCGVAFAMTYTLSAAEDLRVNEVRHYVADLRTNDAETREQARLTLSRPEYTARLTPYRQDLLIALTNEIESPGTAEILGRFTLPPDVSAALISAKSTPKKVRARLGDKAAEEEVIHDFQAAKSLVQVRATCFDLLYVGTPAADQAFAKALGSQCVLEDVHGNQNSQVQVLLRCQILLHPEDAIVTSEELAKHENISEANFKAPVHQDFLRRLESVVRERWGVKVTIAPPLLSLYRNPGKLPARVDDVAPIKTETKSKDK